MNLIVLYLPIDGKYINMTVNNFFVSIFNENVS